MIETRAPNGSFWIDTAEKRPAVMIAGGVGATPMISMAREVVNHGVRRRHLRPLTVFHVARTTAERAFAGEFVSLQKATGGALRYFSLISQPGANEAEGQEFHIAGRLTSKVLQRYLPLADYDFFLCGPSSFMQAVYDMLLELGVRDARIFAESFGPATLTRRPEAGGPSDTLNFEAAEYAVVNFETSGVEQGWTPREGTLLEFAEAHGLSPDFGCRNGACGTCAVKLISGKIGYETPTDLSNR